MASVLASVEWPGLTYLLGRRLKSMNITDTSEIILGDLTDSLENINVIFDPDRWRLLESLLMTHWKRHTWSDRCVEFC